MFTLNCRGTLLAANRPLVMGIINVTPDSFYEGSRFMDEGQVLQQADRMLQEGAAILDLGAQSTRPQAVPLSEEEELARLPHVVAAIVKRFPKAILSIDSYYSKVARECVGAGASIINDISGGLMDDDMLATAGALGVPFICMHMKGTPQTMNQLADYADIGTELLDYFVARIDACHRAGIADIVIDPGFGFSKNREHNLALLGELARFRITACPLLVGLSRKSTIYKTLGVTPAEALNGTTALHMIALLNGADMLRVHDVREAVECVTLFTEYQKYQTPPKRG